MIDSAAAMPIPNGRSPFRRSVNVSSELRPERCYTSLSRNFLKASGVVRLSEQNNFLWKHFIFIETQQIYKK